MSTVARCALVAISVAACGSGGRSFDAGGSMDGPANIDASPPDAISADAACGVSSPVCPRLCGSGGAHTVFLNFNGVTMTKAAVTDATANESATIPMTGTITAFHAGLPGRLTEIAEITSQVRQLLGPYDIDIVDTRPATGPYQMIVFGGNPQSLGYPSPADAVALGDCGDSVPSDIAFLFDHFTTDETRLVSSTVVGMIGINAGMPTSNEPGDCMCFNGSTCYMSSQTLCTFGVGVTVNPMSMCLSGTQSTLDEPAMFMAAFGCRP